MKLTAQTAKRVTELLSGMSIGAPGRAGGSAGVDKPSRARNTAGERPSAVEESTFERALRERKEGLSAAQERREPAIDEPAASSTDAQATDAEQHQADTADEQDASEAAALKDGDASDVMPGNDADQVIDLTMVFPGGDAGLDRESQIMLTTGSRTNTVTPNASGVVGPAGVAATSSIGSDRPGAAISTLEALRSADSAGRDAGAAAAVTGTDSPASSPVPSPGDTPTQGRPGSAAADAGALAQAGGGLDQPMTIDSLNRMLLMQPDAALPAGRPTVFGADPLGLMRSASRSAGGSISGGATVKSPADPLAARSADHISASAMPSVPARQESAGSGESSSAGQSTASASPSSSAPGAARPEAAGGRSAASATSTTAASGSAVSAGAARPDAQALPASPGFAAQVQRAINAVESQLRSRSGRPTPVGRTASPSSQITPPNPASSGSVVVRLHPEGLGQMRVHLSMQGDAAKLRFQVGGEQARELLASSLDSLRSALEAKGLSVDRAQVELSPSLSPVLAQPQSAQPAPQTPSPPSGQSQADPRQFRGDVGGGGEQQSHSGNDRSGSEARDPRANTSAAGDAALAPELLISAPMVIDTARGRVRVTA